MPDLYISSPNNNPSPSSSTNPFSSFCENPIHVTFNNQESDEVIIFTVRRHGITNLPWIFIAVILSIIPLFIPLIFQLNDISDWILSPRFIFFLSFFYYLLIIGFIIVNFLEWFYNIGIVTNKKVVDIDYSYITYKSVSGAAIQSIEDVEYQQNGFIKTFFDFGDVLIQTEGIKPNIEYKSIPSPARVADKILKLRQDIPNAN